MDKAALIEQVESSTNSFLGLFEQFPADKLHLAPSPGSWSAAQVLEHLLIVESGVNNVMLAPPQAKEERNPDEKVAYIAQIFNDMDRRYQAGAQIHPRGKQIPAEELIEKFRSVREKLIQIIEDQNLAISCGAFTHQVFGNLTRLEWVHFNIIHARRHREQLKRIQSVVAPA